MRYSVSESPILAECPRKVPSHNIIHACNKTGLSCLFFDIYNNGNDMCMVTLRQKGVLILLHDWDQGSITRGQVEAVHL